MKTQQWNLYAADLRRHVQPDAAHWVDKVVASTWDALKKNERWKTHPCIITDDRHQIVDNNQIDMSHA